MQLTFLRLTLRGLLKNKVYSFINLTGLTIGLIAFIFIQLYIDVEKSYDQFHENKSRIFRIQQDRYNQGELTQQTVAGNAGIGMSLMESLPEVERYVRMIRTNPVIQYNDVSYKEEKCTFVSDDFFRIFSFPLIRGVDSLVLKNPYAIVLSESAAKRYFKDEDPIGKMLRFRGRMDVMVTGVFKDMPENSHMHFDVLVSLATLFQYKAQWIQWMQEEPWKWDSFCTYLLLNEHADYKAVEAKLPSIVEAEAGEWLRESSQDLKFALQPVTDIHLHSNFNGEHEPNGDAKNVFYLQLISIFIIVIAWFNYISLATAKSVERSKEVGIRKVLGSNRMQLIRLFLAESLLMNVVAALVSIVVVYFFLPEFSELTNRYIDLSFWQYKVWWFVPVVIMAGTLASGLYPAFVLSSFKPALILKGKFSGSTKGQVVRKAMVLVPFVTAITLVSCLYIIYQQISFLQNRSLGFSMEQKLLVRDSEIYDSLFAGRRNTFASELLRIPGISQVTYADRVPGEPLEEAANGIRRIGLNRSEGKKYNYITADENFVDVFQLKLLAGRNFKKEDQKGRVILINETACKQLGFKNYEEAIEAKINFIEEEDTLVIKGVINDFYHQSPKIAIPPVLYVFDQRIGGHYLMPVQTANVQEVVQSVQLLFASVFPAQPFHYFFLDDKYNNQYKLDIQFGKIVGLFSTLLIVVAALGLFGLSAYTAAMRTKEIGVRKVLGATESQILTLLCKEYVVLIVIATIIGVPAAWYVMSRWLDTFASKIDLTPFVFILPVGLVLMITLLTISFQTLKATLTNPVDTLRNE